jgi:hypothetical protein
MGASKRFNSQLDAIRLLLGLFSFVTTKLRGEKCSVFFTSLRVALGVIMQLFYLTTSVVATSPIPGLLKNNEKTECARTDAIFLVQRFLETLLGSTFSIVKKRVT